MKPKRWKFREHDGIVHQSCRQLAVGLITGGVIGLTFMPSNFAGFLTGIIPVIVGTVFLAIGVLERTRRGSSHE